MENQEIVEGNMLIAGFMGYEVINHPSCGSVYSIEGGLYKAENLMYESSWNWLMPVMAKLNNTPEYFSVYIPRILYDISIEINPQFIENTWSAVVDFIKWYNARDKK